MARQDEQRKAMFARFGSPKPPSRRTSLSNGYAAGWPDSRLLARYREVERDHEADVKAGSKSGASANAAELKALEQQLRRRGLWAQVAKPEPAKERKEDHNEKGEKPPMTVAQFQAVHLERRPGAPLRPKHPALAG